MNARRIANVSLHLQPHPGDHVGLAMSDSMITALDDALVVISALRDEIYARTSMMSTDDETTFLQLLNVLEAQAVELIDECEQRIRVTSH